VGEFEFEWHKNEENRIWRGKNRIWEVWKYECFGSVLLNIHLSHAAWLN